MSIEDITNPRVFKFWLGLNNRKAVAESTGVIRRFLNAKLQQDDQLVVWAEVVPSCLKTTLECILVATGDEVPKNYQYLSTVQNSIGLVYHVYVRPVI